MTSTLNLYYKPLSSDIVASNRRFVRKSRPRGRKKNESREKTSRRRKLFREIRRGPDIKEARR